MLLQSLQNNFLAVGGDVEIANVEIGSQIGQLALGAGFQIPRPLLLAAFRWAWNSGRAQSQFNPAKAALMRKVIKL